ncbi:MAG: CapA family protein [Candidatus Cryptobacteroides sp.]
MFPVIAVGQRLDASDTAKPEIRFPRQWLEEMADIRPLYTQDTLTLCFVGDMMMHSAQLAAAGLKESAAGGTFNGKAGRERLEDCFAYIKNHIVAADLAVANMECTFAGSPYSGYPCFSAPDEYAYAVADTGFDVFCCANNHIFDKGSAGAERTMQLYRDMGIPFTGIASDSSAFGRPAPVVEPLLTAHKGIKIAFINFSYGTNTRADRVRVNLMSDRAGIEAAIRQARRTGTDVVIALPHWGEEYRLKHNSAQREMAEWLVSKGVDAVIGCHPHVVQDYETIDGRPVVYSMGNFISNMSAENTQLGMIAGLEIIRRADGRVSVSEPSMMLTWCSRPGGFNDNYTVLPVAEVLGRAELWKNRHDYDKMKRTYDRTIKSNPEYDKQNHYSE